MDDMTELTPAEEEALRRLPREAEPGAALEERVVRELEARGLLARGTGRSGEEGSPRDRPLRLPRWAAAAAGLALFLGGGVAGHALGARTATETMLAVREQDAALQVQTAGTAYVDALVDLARMRERGGEAGVVGQGTEAAEATLHAAATTLSRLDPDDAVLRLLAEVLAERRGGPVPAGRVQRTIWF